MRLSDREVILPGAKPTWALWGVWMLATAIGVVAGLALIAETVGRLAGIFWVGLLGGIVVGAGIGLGQWSILRRYLPNATWWIWATALGQLVSWFIVFMGAAVLLFADANAAGDTSQVTWSAGAAVIGTLAGGATGLAQWVVLQRYMPHADRWVVASAMGTALGLIMGGAVYQVMSTGGFAFLAEAGTMVGLDAQGAGMVILLLLGELVAASVTGLAMLWLVQDSLSRTYPER